MKTLPTSRWLTAFLGLAMVTAPLTAQRYHEHQPIPNEDVAKADKLFAEAEAIMADCVQDEWAKAADLYMESSKLRPCHDPKLFTGLKEAANIYYYLGRLDRAFQTMKKAADHAMLVGDVQNAAVTYMDAAVLAAEKGDRNRAAAYIARSEDLSSSPLLASADLTQLKTRLRLVSNTIR